MIGGVKIKKKSRYFRNAGIVVSILFLVIVYYETKMLDLLFGIFKLEVLKKNIATISLKSYMFITKNDDLDTIVDEMNLLGWKFKNSYGRGYLFSKKREEILLVRKHHLNYYIYEVQNKEFFISKNS